MARSSQGSEEAASSPPPETTVARSPFLEALAEAIRAAYGDRLSEAEFRSVCDRLARSRDLMATLCRYPLQNGDEPDFLFAAFRQEG